MAPPRTQGEAISNVYLETHAQRIRLAQQMAMAEQQNAATLANLYAKEIQSLDRAIKDLKSQTNKDFEKYLSILNLQNSTTNAAFQRVISVDSQINKRFDIKPFEAGIMQTSDSFATNISGATSADAALDRALRQINPQNKGSDTAHALAAYTYDQMKAASARKGAEKREKEIAARTAAAAKADQLLQAGNLEKLATTEGEFKDEFGDLPTKDIEKILLDRVAAGSDMETGASGVVPSGYNPAGQAMLEELIRKQKEKALEKLVSDADDEAPTEPIVEQPEVPTEEEAQQAAASFAVGDFKPYKTGGKTGYKIKSLNPDGTIKDYIYVNKKGQDTNITLTQGMIDDPAGS